MDPTLKGTSLNYLAGVIGKEESDKFKRLIFRITKGNSWIYMSDI